MKWTIIADSSCDLRAADVQSEFTTFTTVAMNIDINEETIVDDENLCTKDLVAKMKLNKSAPRTACPSPEAFAEKMREGNENIIAVTITSKLSGTYDSACLAANMVKAENPGKNIYVLDSLATSGSMILMINRMIELIGSGKHDFNAVVEEIQKYRSKVRLRFLLQNFGNLIKTGRMSRVAGIIASTLNLKLVCGENGKGEIEQVAKCIGMKKALQTLSDCTKDKVAAEGKDLPVVISHCHNEEDASLLKTLLETKFGLKNIKVILMRGLASFYANEYGIIMAY